MTNLQTTSDELKEASGRGTPQESAQPEAAEATHRPASDFKASGLVLPRHFSRKRGSGFPLTLPAAVKKDVFLNALLEVPAAKPPRRNPLEWAGAMSLHLVILAVLIIVPLYTTGTIHVPDYDAVRLIAPAPPPLPAPPAAATAPHVASHPKTELTFRYYLKGADHFTIQIADSKSGAIASTEAKVKRDEEGNATFSFKVDGADKKGPHADEVIFLLPAGAELRIDEVLLYEPGP